MKIKWEKPDIVDQASYLCQEEYKLYAKQLQNLGVAVELMKVNNKMASSCNTYHVPIARNFLCHLFQSHGHFRYQLLLSWDVLVFFSNQPLKPNLIRDYIDLENIKFQVRCQTEQLIVVTPLNFLESEIDLCFTGKIPRIRNAWVIFAGERINSTEFFRTLTNHMHYCLGKRDLYALRDTLIDLIKNQVKSIRNLDLTKSAKLVIQVETWQGLETYTITLNMNRLFLGEVRKWDAKVKDVGEAITSLLEKVKRRIMVENPRVTISEKMYLRKIQNISYFSVMMKYSDHLASPVSKPCNGWYYDPQKGYFAGYFFGSDEECQEMDMHVKFTNWEKVHDAYEDTEDGTTIIGCLDIQLKHLRIFDRKDVIFM